MRHFEKRHDRTPGYRKTCIDCSGRRDQSARNLKYRMAHPEKQKVRDSRPERKKQRAVYSAIWRKNNPEKVAAYKIMKAALKTGALRREPCFICGENAHAHHSHYSMPLDVTWLCSLHHLQAHALGHRLTRNYD